MKLSQSVTYAVHAALRLAESRDVAPISCGKLAASGNMPERFLLQILRDLAKQGILQSTRGGGGGFMLDRRPEEVSLLEVIEGDCNITDNVRITTFQGHTPGLQTVIAENEEGKHFFASDLVPMAGHLHIPYIASYDHDRVMVSREKQTILENACREGWTIYFCHDPVVEKGQVTKEKGKFRLKVE